ncbi:hypothetical protein [Formivibrio citricus]|uniref:hypothetical protein n=1 Tax=Formivibrio citricus TaxID=83765 RepID=UPI0015A6872A|nr:hypothetical protein [Formivibrio citricus]
MAGGTTVSEPSINDAPGTVMRGDVTKPIHSRSGSKRCLVIGICRAVWRPFHLQLKIFMFYLCAPVFALLFTPLTAYRDRS